MKSKEEFKLRFTSAMFEAYGKGNVDALDEINDPEIIIHFTEMPDTLGVEAHKQYMRESLKSASDVLFKYTEWIFDGNRVALRFTETWKHTGEITGFPPPSGKTITNYGCMFLHLKKGKIKEAWMFCNEVDIYQQLGFKLTLEN
jgi:predicted ester cyclase